jgi:hypothetical protein
MTISMRTIHTPMVVVALTGCIAGAVLAVNTNARAVISTVPSGTWFANDNADSVSHLGPGGVDATVAIRQPTGALTVVELEGVAYFTDEAGHLSRIDPVQLSVSSQTILPNDTTQLVAGGGRLYAVDSTGGLIRQLDPITLATIGTPIELDGSLGHSVVDSDGVLWVVDRDRGAVVSVDGQDVDPSRVIAAPGSDVQLSVVGNAVTAVDAGAATITVIAGPGAVATHPIPVSAASMIDSPDLVEGSSVLPLVTDGNSLITVNVGTGQTGQTALDTNGHRLGTPVVADDKIYVPDFTTGSFIVLDARSGAVVRTISVTGRPGVFQVVVDGQTVYVNDPDSEQAWSIGPDGSVNDATKYVPNGDGAGASVAASSTGSVASTSVTTLPPPSIPPAPTNVGQPNRPTTTTKAPGASSSNGSRPPSTQPNGPSSAAPTTTTRPPLVLTIPVDPPSTSSSSSTSSDSSTTSGSSTTVGGNVPPSSGAPPAGGGPAAPGPTPSTGSGPQPTPPLPTTPPTTTAPVPTVGVTSTTTTTSPPTTTTAPAQPATTTTAPTIQPEPTTTLPLAPRPTTVATTAPPATTTTTTPVTVPTGTTTTTAPTTAPPTAPTTAPPTTAPPVTTVDTTIATTTAPPVPTTVDTTTTAPITTLPPPAAPSAVTGLTVNASTISWGASAGATSYEVDPGDGSPLLTVTGTSTAWEAPFPGESTFVTVWAIGPGGRSAPTSRSYSRPGGTGRPCPTCAIP